MGTGSTAVNAILGAVVTVLLAFTGISPIIGGGVAGYLQGGEGAGRVGAISGALATIPLLLFSFAVFGAFLSGLPVIGRIDMFPGGVEGIPGGMGGIVSLPHLFGAAFLLAFVFTLVWTVVLSAIGGYLGAYLATATNDGR